MFSFLSDKIAIVTLLGLTLLVLLLLAVVVWAAMKGAQQADKPAAEQPRLLSADSLKQSFRVAVDSRNAGGAHPALVKPGRS